MADVITTIRRRAVPHSGVSTLTANTQETLSRTHYLVLVLESLSLNWGRSPILRHNLKRSVISSLATYVQDDWKVNDKLTLNLGLRYEYIASPLEEQNSFIWPDFSAPGGALYVANPKLAQAWVA